MSIKISESVEDVRVCIHNECNPVRNSLGHCLHHSCAKCGKPCRAAGGLLFPWRCGWKRGFRNTQRPQGQSFLVPQNHLLQNCWSLLHWPLHCHQLHHQHCCCSCKYLDTHEKQKQMINNKPQIEKIENIEFNLPLWLCKPPSLWPCSSSMFVWWQKTWRSARKMRNLWGKRG